MVAKKGLEYAKVLSVNHQSHAKDAFTENSKALEQIRRDVDVTHIAWHEEAVHVDVGDSVVGTICL